MSTPGTDRAARPPPAPCGLLMMIEAILKDSAAEVARIELQMGAASGDAAVIHQGLAAVAVVDRAGRLLQTQREAVLDQLGDLVLGAEEDEDERRPRPLALGPRLLTLAGRRP